MRNTAIFTFLCMISSMPVLAEMSSPNSNWNIRFKYEAYLTRFLNEPGSGAAKEPFVSYDFKLPDSGTSASQKLTFAIGTPRDVFDPFQKASANNKSCISAQRNALFGLAVHADGNAEHYFSKQTLQNQIFQLVMKAYFLSSVKTLETSKYVLLELQKKNGSTYQTLGFLWTHAERGACQVPATADLDEVLDRSSHSDD